MWQGTRDGNESAAKQGRCSKKGVAAKRVLD